MPNRFDVWSLEGPLRRLFLLRGDMPDPSGVSFSEHSSGNLEMNWMSETETEANFSAWHQQPRRAHLIHEALRRLAIAERGVSDWVYDAKTFSFREDQLSGLLDLLPGGRKLNSAIARRRLSEARLLTVDSFYIHSPESSEFEGFIDLGQGVYFPVHFASRNLVSEILDSDTSVSLPEEIVYLNYDYLTPEIIEQAISGWYLERHRYRPGHWTQPGDRAPRVCLKARFEYGAPEGSVRALSL